MSPAIPGLRAGTIEEVLPSSMLRIRLEDGTKVVATPTRAAIQKWTKFMPGDRVLVELSPFDPTRGRITARE